jgi:hypothetical protein
LKAAPERPARPSMLALGAFLALAITLTAALTISTARQVSAGGRQMVAVGRQVYTLAAQAYTVKALSWARGQGVFETPQQGVIYYAWQDTCGLEKVDIEQAATNSFDGSDPHVWFVMYTIYAQNHPPCDLEHPGPRLYHGTFERGGVFFLNVKEGWVRMPEGKFPTFIGHWMKVLGLAGPGDPTHVPRY